MLPHCAVLQVKEVEDRLQVGSETNSKNLVSEQ